MVTHLSSNEESAFVGWSSTCMQDAFCGWQRGLVGTLVNVELPKDHQRTIQ